MSAKRPSVLFWVEASHGGTPWKYAEKGGGKYTRKDHAEACVRRLRQAGHDAELFEGEVTWSPVELEVDPNGPRFA